MPLYDGNLSPLDMLQIAFFIFNASVVIYILNRRKNRK